MEVQQPDRKDKWKHKTNSELGMCDLIAVRTRFGFSHSHIGETGKQRNSRRPPETVGNKDTENGGVRPLKIEHEELNNNPTQRKPKDLEGKGTDPAGFHYVAG